VTHALIDLNALSRAFINSCCKLKHAYCGINKLSLENISDRT